MRLSSRDHSRVNMSFLTFFCGEQQRHQWQIGNAGEILVCPGQAHRARRSPPHMFEAMHDVLSRFKRLG